MKQTNTEYNVCGAVNRMSFPTLKLLKEKQKSALTVGLKLLGFILQCSSHLINFGTLLCSSQLRSSL